ncbi:peroxisomal acyl-coenzyme A oxidase 1-like [Sycon ciliatum]|uniref:peroxisomal acyl-coenzyme A oxidase 1-like n=1 Tax=Sycon ciliatum TaxID=27933 RepID=UPI0020ACCE79|eukprot:scpid48343/ scgid12152/ Peroxisomal acyl-coenzyme A oxidase 1; Palmitoyl-CoA oxidase
MASRQSQLLQAERKKATFDVDELSHVLYGGEEQFQRRKKIENIIYDDPVLCRDDICFLSRPEEYKRGLQRSKRAVELHRELGLERGTFESLIFWHAVDDESLPIGLHLSMFSHVIRSQATEEQMAKWLPLVKNFSIIGCYAQTELGHGSFVRGLETRVEYDRSRQEFILDTPTVTSMKWWPGGLGKTATHALVVGRLFIDGKELGVHMFLVPLRDLTTHVPLPGISVGDIGPKLGYESQDNGFLGLDKVRVPRENMMMKYAEVTPDGKYVPRTKESKMSYGTMLFIRAHMVLSTGIQLSKAATIATRYSAVREQGHIDPKQPEVAVLDYVSQQHSLMPLVATSLAYFICGRWLTNIYFGHQPENAEELQELHAMSACLKATSTATSSLGVETCRRRCGGHGYSVFSGIPLIYKWGTAGQTYEGENMVMWLQTARFLVKCIKRVQYGEKLTGSSQYLSRWLRAAPSTAPILHNAEALSNPAELLKVFECAAARLVALAGQQLDTFSRQEGLSKEHAWNRASPWLVRASKAHAELLIYQHFAEVLDDEMSSELRAVLQSCVLLYGLHRIEEHSIFFLETGTLSTTDMQAVHDHVGKHLQILRPNAVSLVDAFCHHDMSLLSALGANDGDVYQRLYDMARKAPLNKTQVADGIHQYLKPVMKAKI